jgi:hypothetical protein
MSPCGSVTAVKTPKKRCAADARKGFENELKTVLYSYVDDGGWPSGIGFQERVSNQPELLRSKGVVVSVG